MLEEQKNTIAIFRQNIDKQSFGRFVIYGTGVHAEGIVNDCRDYPLEGVMDIAKTGQRFCGLSVLSPEEIQEKGIRKIVIIARPAVHTIIYKRIREWCMKYQIEVFDIYGINMEERMQDELCDSPYFHVSYDQLIKEIDTHEIISFDIFDTVLMRRVYEPTDVFLLVDFEIEEELPCRFLKMRKMAEQELLRQCEPNLRQIYEYMGRKYHLSQELCARLMDRELQKERQVLVVRKRMKSCIDYCKEQGKRLFFVSDMYLPSDTLKDLLKQFGITGYEDVLVSCEYNRSKPKGLFEVLKEMAKGGSCLHIGDHEEADYCAAQRSGIDAFLIMPAMRMLEISSYKNALTYLNGLESRVMLGMLAAEVFNDPFCLYASQGRPTIKKAETFGFSLIAPLVASYMVWMLSHLLGKEGGILLFSARDGWMIQKAYHIVRDKWKLKVLSEDIYLMISRKVVMKAVEEPDSPTGIAYGKYLESLGLNSYRQIYFFDFMSRGTCQAKLEKILGRKMTGLYFQKSVSGDLEKDAIDVESFFKETSAHDSNLWIFAMCDFLECIMTSYQPSFIDLEADGTLVYDREKRSKEQIKCLKKIHKGILRYCECFADIIGKFPVHMSSAEFCDELLRYTGSAFSRIDIWELKEFMLDDWLGGDKNTGRDALL